MLSDLNEALIKAIHQSLQACFNYDMPRKDIVLQPTKKEFEGSHTFITFPLAKPLKTNPQNIGETLGEYLQQHYTWISGFNIVKGFLNLTLTEDVWKNQLHEVFSTTLEGKRPYGYFDTNGQKVMIEYSSPNTNKPLHLGHLRNNFLGYSVSLVLEACGYEVIKTNLVNDRGIHICKSMLAYKKLGNGATPENSGKKGDHLVGEYYVLFDQKLKEEVKALEEKGYTKEEAEKQAPLMQEAQEMLQKWERGDEETVNLWQMMNQWVYDGFEQTYAKMGVEFDTIYKESDTYKLGKDLVNEGLEKGVFYQKDNGSVWCDLSNEGFDEKLVLRADSTSVYMTQDLGTAELRQQEHAFDYGIYVVGNEQDYHFQVLFTILKKLGRQYADGLYHLSYGMVDLPTGKMKSREGTVVDADDLMDEMVQTAERHTKELGKIESLSAEQANHLYEILGLGALKYFLLKVEPRKKMLFDPEESIQFQGNTGPFIQYTHARISAILRKADEKDEWNWKKIDWNQVQNLTNEELELVYYLSSYPDKVQQAGHHYDPSYIADYIFELAKAYNRFYTELSIFNADSNHLVQLRVMLSALTAEVIKQGMHLLSIEVPERM